ncbi:MAG: hypothetical protein GX823_03780 [Clostridiales bacterium]|nr:hypothetical protein [Clostridiales bacterium]
MIKKRILAALIAVITVVAMAVPASAADIKPVSVALGYSHGAAVGSDGTVYTWGENVNGQIGNGTATTQISPVAVLTGGVSVSAGKYHTLALLADNTLWAWGESIYGQIGTGRITVERSPVKVMDDIVLCVAGNLSSFAVTSDGTLWAWGNNDNALLGDNSQTKRLAPVKIMEDVVSVASGTTHTLAVKTDGTLWAWGSNDYGQLGDNSRRIRTAPVKVAEGMAEVWAGGQNSMALGTDGSLYSWGANTYGQVGDGSRIDRLVPVKILEDVATAAIGGGVLRVADSNVVAYLQSGHGLAVKSDGTLWSWGGNSNGQVGDGTRVDRLSPVQIMSGIAKVAASCDCGAAIGTDGALYTWGYNTSGQLGNGSRTASNKPVKILTDIGGATAAETAPTALVSKQSVLIDGKSVAFDAYNIGGNNYFKLRDLAMALKDTDRRFSVMFDGSSSTIGIGMGGAYTPIGGELSPGSGKAAYTLPSTHKVVIDGVRTSPDGYNIGGSNYFKLRDFLKDIDVYVGYDETTYTVIIDTSKGYAG